MKDLCHKKAGGRKGSLAYLSYGEGEQCLGRVCSHVGPHGEEPSPLCGLSISSRTQMIAEGMDGVT